jgi:glycosyltransferase involved in cell wall biosynthesis
MFKKFAYARRAALSFFKHTPEELNPMCLVPDDHSPAEFWGRQNWDAWMDELPKDRVILKRFPNNNGLTRSWNWGLQMAKSMGATYTIAGNSDILFSPHWHEGLIYNLENGYHLVGPVTNTPGPTNRGRQKIHHFYPKYKVSDDAVEIAKVAEHLRETQEMAAAVRININGFFMMARTDVWWSGAYNQNVVFNPKHKMTFNEDELQRRWSKLKRKVGFVPRSFIFHYRAVSRGDRHKHGAWYRLANTDLNKPV